jgi:hypothetical protein
MRSTREVSTADSAGHLAHRSEPVVKKRMPGPNRATLIARANTLIAEAAEVRAALKAADDEAVKLSADPFANTAAVRRANERSAWVQGVARGWLAAGWAEYPTLLQRGD